MIFQKKSSLTQMTVTTELKEIHEAKTDRLKGDIDESTIIVGDFNIPPSEMDSFYRQKISEDRVEFNTFISQYP